MKKTKKKSGSIIHELAFGFLLITNVLLPLTTLLHDIWHLLYGILSFIVLRIC